MKVVIIDNYDSFTFNLYQLLAEVGATQISVFRNDEITLPKLKELRPDRIVLSPGPGHPELDRDFGVCRDIIKHLATLGCSLLGVCLGHQGLVQHLGGKIVGAAQIVHGKASQINVQKESPIFFGLPNIFRGMRYHSLVAVEDESFPAQLEIIARENEYKTIMAIQHKFLPAYGLQFHPESIGTPLGKQILRNFIERC